MHRVSATRLRYMRAEATMGQGAVKAVGATQTQRVTAPPSPSAEQVMAALEVINKLGEYNPDTGRYNEYSDEHRRALNLLVSVTSERASMLLTSEGLNRAHLVLSSATNRSEMVYRADAKLLPMMFRLKHTFDC